jgi:hypothetical protein
MPVSITLTETPSNNTFVVFPSQITKFTKQDPAETRPNANSVVSIGPSTSIVCTNTVSSLIAATPGLCIPLNVVSNDGRTMFNSPVVTYYAVRTITSFTATNASAPLFGTAGFNTRVEIEGNTSDGTDVYFVYISQTVAEIRALYNGTVIADNGYVRSVSVCDGPQLTGDVNIPCHVTGVTIGNSSTVLRGVVNIPQPAPSVISVSLGSGLPETGQVNIPVNSTSANATLISGTELSTLRSALAPAIPKSIPTFAFENYSVGTLYPYNSTAEKAVVYMNVGTAPTGTKAITLSQKIGGVLKPGLPITYEVYFGATLDGILLSNDAGGDANLNYSWVNKDNGQVIGSSLLVLSVKAFRATPVSRPFPDGVPSRTYWLFEKLA